MAFRFAGVLAAFSRIAVESSNAPRSGPRSLNAWPSSSITEASFVGFTEFVRLSRVVNSSCAETGISVRLIGMTTPLCMYGGLLFGGIRFTYCSPITERSDTTAVELTGMPGLSQLSMCRSTCTPPSIRCNPPTLPIATPR